MRYDILSEKWIPAIRLGEPGRIEYFGLYDLLQEAHRLEGIHDSSPLREYGMYRLLCAWIMDAFQPEVSGDIGDLLEAGSVPMPAVDQYIEKCRAEGVSFDLFDPERPFLQCPYDARWDDHLKPVAALDCMLPSGNSHVHFDHTLEQESVMTAGEALRALCAVNVFCTAAVQLYPSTVNGAPPEYFIVRGRNLFETLVFSILPQSAFGIAYGRPGAYWRDTGTVEPKLQVASTSVLYGMTFPCRRVRLIPESDDSQLVRQVNLQQGLNFVGYDSWEDPHVVYRYNEKGRFSLKPNPDKQPWRNLDAWTDYEHVLPVVGQYVELRGGEEIHVVVYGAATKQAAYLECYRGEIDFPTGIVGSVERSRAVKEGLAATEQAGKALRSSLRKVWEAGKDQMIDEELTVFYSICKGIFLDTFCRRMTEVGIEELPEVEMQYRKACGRAAYRCLDRFVDRSGLGARLLLRRQEAARCLNQFLFVKKEGAK